MRAVSRWALFLQGSLDALTYGVFAFKVKKSVGKEIKQRWPWLAHENRGRVNTDVNV